MSKNMNDGFLIGCNYWASHAGTAMWSDWKPEIIDEDFRVLTANGINVLRVFPLWPDFQPVTALYEAEGGIREYRFGEEPLQDNEIAQAGVSVLMLDRFAEFTGLAAKHDLHLIVSLITGWMSGRLFVPPALEGRDILTDPLSVKFQVKFVRCFVNRFKDNKHIYAWGLGNECNVMQDVPGRDSAWVWTSAVSNAIRSIDISRPIISDMHSLTPNGKWAIEDQAENTDILTTHPYPIFTPYCDQDPIDTIRPLLHSAAESAFYQSIGRKPCLVEEIGTIGPTIANEEVTASFVRVTLFSAWADGFPGYLWWCANDQTHLSHAPYDWNSCERELGLLRVDRSPKPVINEMKKFSCFLDESGLSILQKKVTEAVCIVSNGQDQWAAAYSAYILAKQAGFDVDFQTAEQPIRDAGFYLLPSVVGDKSISRRRLSELMEKVKKGAVLYISTDGGILSPFEEITGVRAVTRERRVSPSSFAMQSKSGPVSLSFSCDFKMMLKATSATILATEPDGNPVFTRLSYGKGTVYFLGFPLETMTAHIPGVFHSRHAEPYYKLYHVLNPSSHIICSDNPFVCITEHKCSEDEQIDVIINYSPEEQDTLLELAENWAVKSVLYGSASERGQFKIPGCDAVVISLVKKQ